MAIEARTSPFNRWAPETSSDGGLCMLQCTRQEHTTSPWSTLAHARTPSVLGLDATRTTTEAAALRRSRPIGSDAGNAATPTTCHP